MSLLDESDDDSSDSDMEDEPCLQGAESCDSESYMSCSSDNLDLNSPSHDIDSDSTSDVSLQQAIPVQSNSVWSTGAQQNRDRFPFTGSPGMKAVVENKEDPLPFFELFFDDSLINLIAEQTNVYAQQFKEEHDGRLKRRFRVNSWADTNPCEIRVYLALLLLQGIIPKPKESLFFSKKESIDTPFFRKIMSSKRFALLSKFLHFSDNSKSNDSIPKKVAKLWPVLVHMKRKFSSVYIPDEHVSIDESLMLWKGRLGWRQYIPSKRARCGIKSYEICDSQSGYIWDVFVYTGKKTAYLNKYHEEKSMGAKCILTLAHELLGKGYCISMDNFFSSTQLFDKLCENSTDAVGTVRANSKDLPRDLMSKILKKGEVAAMYRGKVMALRWRDKKYVNMLSTIHDDSTVEIVVRGKKAVKPQVCLDYNDKMGGVDLSDAYLASYPSARKRLKKYYKKQFRHIMDMATFNAYLLYKKCSGEWSRLKFVLILVDRLIETYKGGAQRESHRPSLEQSPLRLTARHFPEEIPPISCNSKPQRRCHVCYTNKQRKQTHFMCKECDKALCVSPCFKIYHTKKNY